MNSKTIFGIIVLFAFLFTFSCTVIIPEPAHAASQVSQISRETDIMGSIAVKFYEKSQIWANKIVEFAEKLFAAMLLLDVLLFAIKEGLNRASGGSVSPGEVLGKFALMVLLPAMFMYTILHNYQDWSHATINGFKYIAGQAEPRIPIGEGTFFAAGTNLFTKTIGGISLSDPASYTLIIAAIILIVCYALIAMQILMIKCESYIVLSAGVIMLGLGAFDQTRSYAVNFIRYVVAVAVKLYVMQLMIGLMFSFVDDFTKLDSKSMTSDAPLIIGGSIVMLGLIRSIPDICAGIIQGQQTSSGGTFGAAMGSGAGAGGVRGGANSGQAVGAASQTSKAAGDYAFGGTAMSTLAGSAWSAARGNPEHSFTGRLNSAAQASAYKATHPNAQSGNKGTENG
jgi:type IV secretion system protein TrbL